MELVLIGEATGTWPDELRQLIHRLGLEARVRLPGYRGKVASLLPGLDAFVQPSRSEALSLSLLEAMAAGLPVIAARTGGMPEVVEDGVNGLLFPSGDAHALAWQLKRLLEPGLRQRLGQQARRTQRERFSARGMTEATVSLYRRLLEQPV